MQIIEKSRNTNETQVSVALNLRGCGSYEISTPVKFFNHMLELFSAHSMFDLKINANSLDNDPHHLVEDVAITLGQAFNEALADKRGRCLSGNLKTFRLRCRQTRKSNVLSTLSDPILV